VRGSSPLASGDRGALFNTWLFTPGKPALPGAAGDSAAARSAAAARKVPPVAADGLKRLRADGGRDR
jgi:hypothetical protein